jgi:hypothetical protein
LPSTSAAFSGQQFPAGLIASVAIVFAGAGACRADAPPPISGSITMETTAALNIEVLRDDYKFAANAHYKMNYLPHFDFQYVQDGGALIPLKRGSIPGSHPLWEYILEPGRIWKNESKPEVRSVSLPFTLHEHNANCMHNGTLNFSIDAGDQLSPVDVSIANETCLYSKFNLSGALQARYEPGELPQNTAVADFNLQRASRISTRPITSLPEKFVGIDLEAFSGAGRLPLADISTFGFVIDDVHYRGSCQTREGEYAFCEDMNLPSYSIAKTLFAGLAAMRLEKLYPGSRNATISDYVPECRRSNNWSDVTVSQALNMLTGNFGSQEGRLDEHSPTTDKQFFFKTSHADKIGYSCDAWPRNAPPGSRWVYHTTDTYVLGTAINALLRQKQGADANIYTSLILPLWNDMNLGPALAIPRTTYDAKRQPFVGFGLTLLPDDIARLATALNRGDFADKLDPAMYTDAMQRRKLPQGSYPVDGKYYYSNGFWAYNAQSLLGCENPVMVPFMSGFGGINVVMMPNDSVYYIVSDGGKYAFTEVIRQSHKIRSMCEQS